MSNFMLTITTDNAAFDPPGPEIARILTEVASRIRDEGMSAFQNGILRIRDYNGNRVGFATVESPEEAWE
jgi:hypothetical protein